MKTKLGIIALLLWNAVAMAQEGHTGGGSFTEGDFQNYINQIDEFLLSKTGKSKFPEIETYNKTHSESFHDLVMKVRPRIVHENLTDSEGNDRDCLSYIEENPPYFVCNADRIPERKLQNEPTVIRTVFHELLVIAKIEKPISEKIASEYPVSSRITKYLSVGKTKAYKFSNKADMPRSSLGKDQLKELLGQAQGSVLQDKGTHEHLALVKGQRSSYSQQQQQDGLFQPNLTLSDVVESEDIAYALVSVNSRGLRTLGDELELTEIEDFIAMIDAFDPNRISANYKAPILKALGIDDDQYAEAFDHLRAIAGDRPGKLIKLKGQQFKSAKTILGLILSDPSDVDDIKEALGMSTEEEESEEP